MAKNLLTIVLGLCIISCAPEQSDEERRREDVKRQSERLEQSSGSFVGLIRTRNDQTIPISLTNRVQRNPKEGSDKPIISSEARIGMLGGAYLVSTDTSYDFGEKYFVAKFHGEGNSHPIELRISFDDPTSLRGILESSQDKYDVFLAEGDPSEFFETEPNATYLLNTKLPRNLSVNDASAIVSLKPLKHNQTPFEGAEMPALAAIKGSIRFLYLGSNTFENVYYEPLRGRLELVLSSQSRLTFDNFYVEQGITLQDQGTYRPSFLKGHLTQGGDVIHDIKLELAEDGISLTTWETGMPLADYKGTFQGKPGAPVFTAYARIAALQTEGSNPQHNPFPKFNRLKLTTIVCAFRPKYRRLELTAIDYLNSEAFFRGGSKLQENTGAPDDTLIWYNRDWTQLSGVLTNPGPAIGSGSRDHPQFKLTRVTEGIPTRPCEVM